MERLWFPHTCKTRHERQDRPYGAIINVLGLLYQYDKDTELPKRSEGLLKSFLHFQTRLCRSVVRHATTLDFPHLMGVTLRGDDVQGFDSRWDGVLLSIKEMPHDHILESLYKMET